MAFLCAYDRLLISNQNKNAMSFKTPLMFQGVITLPAIIAVGTTVNTAMPWSKYENNKDNPIREGGGDSLILYANCLCFNFCKSYPELSHGVDVLGFEEGVIIAVHQTFPMDYSCIVH